MYCTICPGEFLAFGQGPHNYGHAPRQNGAVTVVGSMGNMMAGGVFVVLRHEIAAEVGHWDLMLEDGGALATWQLACWPVDGGGTGDSAKEILHHRRAYLTYEGPVSGDRGEVRRVDQGVYERLGESPDEWDIRFAGAALRGRYRLWREAGQQWRLQRVG